MTKTCLGCGHDLPIDDFVLVRNETRHGRCHECRKQYHKEYYKQRVAADPSYATRYSRKATLAKYGLTPEEYDEMFDAQGGVCAICQRPPGDRHLVVDHDHTTGTVRSLLCDFCNRGLGIFRDSPDNLIAAAMYLLRHEGGDGNDVAL